MIPGELGVSRTLIESLIESVTSERENIELRQLANLHS
jgi:hypothetical protein